MVDCFVYGEGGEVVVVVVVGVVEWVVVGVGCWYVEYVEGFGVDLIVGVCVVG